MIESSPSQVIKPIVCIFLLFGIFSFSQNNNYTITNLDLNSEHPHFGLMKTIENKVVFTSYELNKKGRVILVGGNPILTIYEGDLSLDGIISNSRSVLIDEDSKIPTITSATVSPDGKYLYITTLYSKKNKPKGDFKETNFHLEVGEYKEGIGWTDFKVLPFCKPRYSYAHPTFSPDGKTLFFTANIRGGKETTKGGSDIFKVEVLENNTFSEPINLGTKVNSYSREMFPFIDDNNTIYFASNRPNGYGGFDIYKSIMNAEGVYEKAEKLPKPINSNKDDFSFISTDDQSGFLVSKRTGGKGDDDIYYFTKN